MNIEYCKFQEFITKPVISKQEIQTIEKGQISFEKRHFETIMV